MSSGDSDLAARDRTSHSYFTEAVREKAITAARVKAGLVAADIGACDGFVTECLVKRGLKVIAVEQSEKALWEIQRKFEGAQIDCRVGTPEQLPVKNGEVDFVFANMYLHHVEWPLRAMREMGRILKPGGRIVITDLEEHHFDFMKEEHRDLWLGFKRTDLVHWMELAGFRAIRYDITADKCCVGGANILIFLASGEKA